MGWLCEVLLFFGLVPCQMLKSMCRALRCSKMQSLQMTNSLNIYVQP